MQLICSRSLSISQIIISEGKIPIGTDHAKLPEMYCKVRNYYCLFKLCKESRSVGQFSNLAQFSWNIPTFLNYSNHSDNFYSKRKYPHPKSTHSLIISWQRTLATPLNGWSYPGAVPMSGKDRCRLMTSEIHWYWWHAAAKYTSYLSRRVEYGHFLKKAAADGLNPELFSAPS